jgi:hypothetical protein
MPTDQLSVILATLFSNGEHLTGGAGVVAIVLFAVNWGHGKEDIPARGPARGRILAGRQLRWMFLALAIVGLLMMLIASI